LSSKFIINPLNAELNPICHLLVLVGAHHIFHVSRIRVKCRDEFQLQVGKNKVVIFLASKFTDPLKYFHGP
jgi:hypothetical protein